MREDRPYRFCPFKIRNLADQRFLAGWTISSFIICLLLTGSVGAYEYYNSLIPVQPDVNNGNNPDPTPPRIPPWEVFGTDKVTFILLGHDEIDDWSQRSDTLMVGAVDFWARTVKIVSIPRDTLVYIPRRSFMKVNSAYALGGEELVKDTVERFLGVEIDYVISVNYQGFVEVVDALGGVDITVEYDMDYDDRRGNTHIHIPAGDHHFDGEMALNYARYRQYRLGDLDRIEHQHELLMALFEQRISLSNAANFKPAIDAFLENITVEVNEDSPRNVPEIGFDEMVSLGGFLSLLSSEEIEFHQIPVEDVSWEDLLCLVPLYNRTRELLIDVFRDDAPIAWRMEVPTGDGVVVEEIHEEFISDETDQGE